MAVTPYCTVEEVASLAKAWTNDGLYTENTNPMRTEIESWIEQCSALIDVSLAGEGFITPVVNETALLVIKSMVVAIVAELCNSANGHGRLAPNNIENGYSPMFVVRKEINDWAVSNSVGLDKVGAQRGTSEKDTIGYSTEDYDGNEVKPIFRRGSFGNQFD